MKIKAGFTLKKVANHYIVVPLNEATDYFKGMIYLNHSSALLFQALQTGIHEEAALIEVLLSEYEVTKEQAKQDIYKFIKELKEVGVLE